MPTWQPTALQYYEGSGVWKNSTLEYWDGATWQPSVIQLYGDAPGDTSAPVVAISSPAAGATISGTQTISGTVTDDVAVSFVALSAGSLQLGEATLAGSSWSIAVDTTSMGNGNLTISATAFDTAGNTASVSRSFVVNNATGPNIDFVGPYVEPSYTQQTTSSITGTLITPTSPKFTYLGVDLLNVSPTSPGFYLPPPIVGTTANEPPFSVKFNFFGQVFELYYTTRGANEEIRIGVNGKWRNQTTTAPYKSSAASGAATYLKIDLGSAASRTITIDMLCLFGGIKVVDVATVSQAATPSFKAVFLSNSLGGAKNKGRGQTASDYTNISSYVLQSAQNVGWQHRYNESIGGSGFFMPGDGSGSGQFINRVQNAIVVRNPNVVFFDAHVFNDLQANHTPTETTSALTSVLSAIRSALPNANIICSLTPVPPAVVTQLGSQAAAVSFIKTFNDPMKPVVAQFRAYVIDPADGRVYDTDGTFIGNPNNGIWQMPSGNTYPSTWLTSDGVHPTEAGSWTFANQTGAAIELILSKPSWRGATGDVFTPGDTLAPSVPLLQTPTATSTSVSLSWTAASDNVALAGYNVYRAGVKQNSSLITGTVFTQSGLSPSTNYGPYTVTAVDTSGNESTSSNQQSVVTPALPLDTTPPTIPTNLQVSPINGGFTATWNPSTDVVGVAGYNVYVNNTKVASATTLSYTATNLTNGVSYNVQVAAFDAAGNESVHTTAVAVTPTATTTPPNVPTALAVVPGNGQLRITWTAPASGIIPLGYNIYLGGNKYTEERVTSTIINELVNGVSYAVTVAAFDSAGTVGPQTPAVSAVPEAPTTYGAPIEVASYGPNGTHYIDRTPYLFGPVATVIECDCTWAAIKTAVNSLTDAQVNAGARVNVRPGSLPGSGASAGSAPMMDTVGKLAWRKRVLVTPRDGRGSITFTGDYRLNKVWNVALVNFDTSPYAGQFTGCSYSGICRFIMSAFRLSGLNTMLTEGFDAVEWIVRDVKVADLDPAAWGSGYSSTGDYTKGNAWLRYCRSIGNYIAPAFLPIDTFDAAGTQLTGYGHNDSLQFYGNGVYYGFIIDDATHFGCDNCALQIGGWGATADSYVGPIPYFMKLNHSLLLQVGVGARVRYPVPPTSKSAGTGGSAINGIGRNGQHFANEVIAPGSLYTSNWANVNASRSTVTRPSVVGAWTLDSTCDDWTKATYDRITPVPDDTRLNSIWSANPPPQSVPTIPAVGATA